MKNCRGWSDHFIELRSNLFLVTPLFYGQFVWSQKCQKPYIPYLYNTDTSVKRTIGSVPLVSVLKRFDCTFQMASDLIHAIGKSRFGFRISQWNENSFSQTPRKFTQTQRRILVKNPSAHWITINRLWHEILLDFVLKSHLPDWRHPESFPHRSTNGHFFFRSGYSILSVYNGHLTLSQCHCREGLLCQVTPENVKAEVLDRKNSG